MWKLNCSMTNGLADQVTVYQMLFYQENLQQSILKSSRENQISSVAQQTDRQIKLYICFPTKKLIDQLNN